MMVEVILGAVIILIGVIVGFIFAMVAIESKKSNTPLVKNTHTNVSNGDHVFANLLNKIDEKERDIMKENLLKVLELLRENSGPIPEDIGDQIEDLVANVVSRMNP